MTTKQRCTSCGYPSEAIYVPEHDYWQCSACSEYYVQLQLAEQHLQERLLPIVENWLSYWEALGYDIPSLEDLAISVLQRSFTEKP